MFHYLVASSGISLSGYLAMMNRGFGLRIIQNSSVVWLRLYIDQTKDKCSFVLLYICPFVCLSVCPFVHVCLPRQNFRKIKILQKTDNNYNDNNNNNNNTTNNNTTTTTTTNNNNNN